MRIANNIMALNAHRQLTINQGGAAKAIEKLSSGFRINRAGDDAAGLAISEKMRGQIRGLNQAMRNAQDGISLIQTAEGALNEVHAILQRMRELAVQAASDTNTVDDRQEIQKEINDLTSEINRIGNTTEFNTMKLLDGSRSATTPTGNTRTVVKSGTIDVATGMEGVTSDLGAPALVGNELTVGDYDGFNWRATDNSAPGNNQITIQKTANGELQVTIKGTQTAGDALDVTEILNVDDLLDADGNIVYDNHGISFKIAKEDFDSAASNAAVTIDLSTAKGNTGNDVTGTYSTRNDWDSNESSAVITGGIVIDGDAIDSRARSITLVIAEDGQSVTVTVWDDVNGTGNKITEETYVYDSPINTFKYNNHGISFEVENIEASEMNSPAELKVNLETEEVAETEDNSLAFQIGANEKQAMRLSINDMRSVALGISSTSGGGDFSNEKSVTDGTNAEGKEYALDVTTHEKAAKAIAVIDAAIANVSAERSKLGAAQNRLEHTISNLGTSAENLQAAESRIRDVDMAQEMMNFTKYQILQQASTAMLAQANLAPQSVLQLLG